MKWDPVKIRKVENQISWLVPVLLAVLFVRFVCV